MVLLGPAAARLRLAARAAVAALARVTLRRAGGKAGVKEAAPTRAIIHLNAIRANFALARKLAGAREVIAVVKADAYGHGAVPVARTLVAAGCRRLAVASLPEAAALREAGVGIPILVLGGVPAPAEEALALDLTPVIHHPGDLSAAAGAARASGRRWPVQVEIDTGMRRMGVPPEQAAGLIEAVAKEPALRLEGVFTHFARADEPDLAPSLEQLAVFRGVLEQARARGVDPGLVHAAQTAGLLAGGPLDSALPEAGAVRIGLLLYGVRPAPHLGDGLAPAMTLMARVLHVRQLRSGDAVGYAALWRARQATRIATLALGYADGLPISASNRGHVWLRGRRLPLIGRVSMDYVGVDLRDAPVEIGDEAVVFGAGADRALLVEEAALAAQTLPYELLVRLGARVPRIYQEA
jgi:alanine racemase